MEHLELPDEQALVRLSLEELEFPKVLEFVAQYAASSLGREIVLSAEPVEDTTWLRLEHQRLDELAQFLSKGEQIPLEGLADIRSALQKSQIQYAYLQPSELLAVRDTFRSSRLLRGFFTERAESMPTLAEMCGILHENRLIEKHISDAIDDVGNIRDTASRELARIRREIFETSNRLRQKLRKILSKVTEEDAGTDEFITLRDGRYVLPMKTEYKRFVPGIIHGVSGTGATVFLEPTETHELNNDLSLLSGEEQREIVKILTTLTVEIGEEARDFLRSMDILAHFDALLAKARYASNYGGFKPDILDENEVYLKDIRHPLLVHAKGSKTVVPLGIEFSDSIQGHLISGPNAGGKTVALKSIGLNIAMALSGIFPLGVCRTNYRAIFAAIGDKQSIENDVSTFSSQILRLREILLNSSPSSLILVDEICSGTDPQEGSALAVGIMEGFIDRKTFFVVTTHQSSLKSYALTRSVISNASMEFNPEKLEPSYRFLSGVPGNSYAFALAKKLGLPPKTMEMAREYLGDKHSLLEESIEQIQKFRTEAESLRNSAYQEFAKSEAKRKEYEAKFAEFKQKYSQLMKVAKEEAATIVANSNKLIEKTIQEVREQSKPVAEIKKEFSEAKERIEKAVEQFRKKAEPAPKDGFSEGDTVTMDEFSMPGTIIGLEGNNAVVEFGSIKFRTTLDKLHHSKTAVKTIKKSEIPVKFDAETRLDLRGKYADESIKEIEQSIGDALVGNIHQLTIIHGKGTGALRAAIHRHLSGHPAVESFRLGDLTEGGAGVTVVILK